MNQTIRIAGDWTGAPLMADDVVTLDLHWQPTALHVRIDAPYAGDPAPPGDPGSTERLWEYEAVELFLVEEPSLSGSPRYLEIEISPHGHHLVLAFNGVRRRSGRHHPRSCRAEIDGARWRGEIVIDRTLVPRAPLRINAFRIHGVGDARRYDAATPVPGSSPDFHLLDAFTLVAESWP